MFVYFVCVSGHKTTATGGKRGVWGEEEWRGREKMPHSARAAPALRWRVLRSDGRPRCRACHSPALGVSAAAATSTHIKTASESRVGWVVCCDGYKLDLNRVEELRRRLEERILNILATVLSAMQKACVKKKGFLSNFWIGRRKTNVFELVSRKRRSGSKQQGIAQTR